MPDNNTVFLFDVDNTLLDNDHVTADLKRHLAARVGLERSQRYWQRFEEIRAELGYADYLGALQRYPFANRLFPNSVDAVQHVGQWGRPVILSDGDVVFQPHKVYRSGLFELFQGDVLIYIHKEQELEDVAQRYPAEHYVLVDDKLRILDAIKKLWQSRVTTVFVRQGHYAHDPEVFKKYPPADISVERIGDLLNYGADSFSPLALAAK
jgi:FMN phosphatase YigB (HAD superfamily)